MVKKGISKKAHTISFVQLIVEVENGIIFMSQPKLIRKEINASISEKRLIEKYIYDVIRDFFFFYEIIANP